MPPAAQPQVMEDLNGLLDMPSPTNSSHYMYGDAEQYLDTATTSESQSPVDSQVSCSCLCQTRAFPEWPSDDMYQYDIAYLPDMSNISNVYPSPGREDESERASQPQKPAAKRKRENRYKNAPPSVLSVSHADQSSGTPFGQPC
jgi:AP-1-like transcription factor